MVNFFSGRKEYQYTDEKSKSVSISTGSFENYVYDRLVALARDPSNNLTEPSWNFAENLADLIKDRISKLNVSYEFELTDNDYREAFEVFVESKIKSNSTFDLLNHSKETKLIDVAVKSFLQSKKEQAAIAKLKEGFQVFESYFFNMFSELDNVLYREPTKREQAWFSEQGLSIKTQVARALPREIKANVELKQRAASMVYAVFLLMQTKNGPIVFESDLEKLQPIQKALTDMLNSFSGKVDKGDRGLANDAFFSDFLKRELEQKFVAELTTFIVNELGVSRSSAGTVLHQFECLANWDRQARSEVPQIGFATITELGKTGLGKTGFMVQISKPLATPLTNVQKNELYSIAEKQKPAWFTALPTETRQWLIQNRFRIISGDLPCPPSVLRFIPTLANVREDLTFFTNTDGQVTFQTSVIRGAVPTAVGVKRRSERERLTQQNARQLEQVLSGFKKHFTEFWGEDLGIEPFILGARYLSPGWYDRNPITRRFVGLDNNFEMNQSSRRANADFGIGEVIIDTVIPVNAIRVRADNLFKDKNNQKARQELNSLTKNILLHFSEPLQLSLGVKTLLTHALLSATDLSQINYRLSSIAKSIFPEDKVKQNRFKVAMHSLQLYQQLWEDYEAHGKIENPHGLNVELLLAACQSLIAEGLGLKVFHGCKSAKDRLAAVEIQKAALARFFLKDNNKGFNLQETEHVNELSRYFADAYASQYNQHVVSNYSSYGIHALQDGRGPTPKSYAQMIPEPYVRAIGKKSLESEAECFARGKAIISRENKLGKTASLGKIKKGFKKFWSALKNFFSSLGGDNRPVVNLDTESIVMMQSKEAESVSVPAVDSIKHLELNYPTVSSDAHSASPVAVSFMEESDTVKPDLKRSASMDELKGILSSPESVKKVTKDEVTEKALLIMQDMTIIAFSEWLKTFRVVNFLIYATIVQLAKQHYGAEAEKSILPTPPPPDTSTVERKDAYASPVQAF